MQKDMLDFPGEKSSTSICSTRKKQRVSAPLPNAYIANQCPMSKKNPFVKTIPLRLTITSHYSLETMQKHAFCRPFRSIPISSHLLSLLVTHLPPRLHPNLSLPSNSTQSTAAPITATTIPAPAPITPPFPFNSSAAFAFVAVALVVATATELAAVPVPDPYDVVAAAAVLALPLALLAALLKLLAMLALALLPTAVEVPMRLVVAV